MEAIKYVGGAASAVIAIATCLALVVKPVRNRLIRAVRNTSGTEELAGTLKLVNESLRESAKSDEAQQRVLDIQSSALCCILRNTITHIYYKYSPIKQLPGHEKENLINLFSVYEALGGNTYVAELYKEMLAWPIKRAS